MKKIDPIKLQTPAGMVEPDCYYRWSKKVGDDAAEFFLHAEPVPGKDRRLFISEASTGFTTMVSPVHPKRGESLTEAAFRKDHYSYLPGAKIKHLCRSALHKALCRVGHERFLEARSLANLRLMGQQYAAMAKECAEKGMTLDIDDVDTRFMDAMQDREDKLQGLHERLHRLKEREAQHGTMTGDTTAQEYEQLSDDIEELEAEIAEMEAGNE